MHERDKELWDKSTTWDSADDGRGKLKILASVAKFAELVRADERKACAKVCDLVVEGKDPDDIHSDSQWTALTLAVEIRARGAK